MLLHARDARVVPSEEWLELVVARSAGNMKVSVQAARSLG
jgi:hypothetical protein